MRLDGRVLAKQEHAAGRVADFAYEYDPRGHLLRVWRDGRLVEEYVYDARGARIADWSPERGPRTLEYDGRGRLVRAGDRSYAYAPDNTLCQVRGPGWRSECRYGRNLALARAVLPDGGEVRTTSAPDGRLLAKYRNDRLVERYAWRGPARLAAWRDETRGEEMRFLYREGRRTPYGLEWSGPGYCHLLLLGCDHVGSIKVVANRHGAVLKTLEWDSFGNLLADSNPEFFLPLGFVGGLVDGDTGQVRFGRRDYMPSVGRFTAQDPLGDTGGDHDPYDYCVDDPVGRVDPTGLQDAAAPAAGGGILDGIGNFFSRIGENVGNWLTGSDSEPEAAPAAAPAQANGSSAGSQPAADGGKVAGAKSAADNPTKPAIEEFNTAGYETPATLGTHATKRGPLISADDEELLKTTPGVYVASDGNLAVSQANIPPLPPGESYERNMQEMAGRVTEPGAWTEFKDKVQPRGQWDYKTRFKDPKYEPTGNFNYGAVAEAMGIPDAVADRAAGAVQRLEHSPANKWNAPGSVKNIAKGVDAYLYQRHGPSYGDDPRDQENIRRGRAYAKQWERGQVGKSQ